MPSRVIDGDKLHQSDKIAALPGWAQPEYPWLYCLADANGVLELTNLRAIYARAYAIRSNFPFSKFTKLIQLFGDVGLLFVFQVGGKRYGYWTGAERRGRLPSPSTRARYNPIGILPPVDQLQDFYKKFGIREASADALVMNQSRLNRDEVVTGLGVGLGVGIGLGKGKGRTCAENRARTRTSRTVAGPHDPLFKKFCDDYPRKIRFKETWAVWRVLPEADRMQAIEALAAFKACEDWRESDGKFIPSPHRFLSERRWEHVPQKGGRDARNGRLRGNDLTEANLRTAGLIPPSH